MKFYLAGRFSLREGLVIVRDDLEKIGFGVTSSWIDQELRVSDTEFDSEFATHRALEDLHDLDECDVMILDANNSTRGGLWVELGYAIAAGKEVWLVGNRSNIFTYHPAISSIFRDWNEVIDYLVAREDLVVI